MFQTLDSYNFDGKRVIVRCDFNVPIKNGRVLDDFKIESALPTINYLKRAGAKVILISHLGRPDKSNRIFTQKELSLRPVAWRLEALLRGKVKFVGKSVGKKAQREAGKLKKGDVLFLENLRFESGEEENDKKFAFSLAGLADAYVGEAFSACHRKHASVYALPKILPRFAGFCLEKEVEVLQGLVKRPDKPLVVIIGGAKLFSKIKVIENFVQKADYILLGGKIVNAILRVKGICVGKPWPEEEVVEKIKKLDLTNSKIRLPIDVLVSPDEAGDIYVKESGPGMVLKEEKLLDIGSETIESFKNVIKGARTIFWSGPLGLVENQKFETGTREVGRAITANNDAFTVIGGGDTIAAARRFGFLDKFCHISTGGGAMLAFMAGEEMPGLEALK